MATTDTNTESLEEFRVAQIEELGFTHDEALVLSASYYPKTLVKSKVARTYQMRVDWHYLRNLLNAGWTKEQIIKVLI
jgi:hypothetical protein